MAKYEKNTEDMNEFQEIRSDINMGNLENHDNSWSIGLHGSCK